MQAEREGVRVEQRGTGTPLVFSGDEARMAQAMTSILGNAIKFSHRGGTVNASLVREEGGGTVRFTVTGTGISIAPEDIDVVIRPFQQAQGAFTRDRGGLGLGLAICAIIARAHGGELRIESTLGEGTTVTLALPRRRAEDAPGDEGEGDSLTA